MITTPPPSPPSPTDPTPSQLQQQIDSLRNDLIFLQDQVNNIQPIPGPTSPKGDTGDIRSTRSSRISRRTMSKYCN